MGNRRKDPLPSASDPAGSERATFSISDILSSQRKQAGQGLRSTKTVQTSHVALNGDHAYKSMKDILDKGQYESARLNKAGQHEILTVHPQTKAIATKLWRWYQGTGPVASQLDKNGKPAHTWAVPPTEITAGLQELADIVRRVGLAVDPKGGTVGEAAISTGASLIEAMAEAWRVFLSQPKSQVPPSQILSFVAQVNTFEDVVSKFTGNKHEDLVKGPPLLALPADTVAALLVDGLGSFTLTMDSFVDGLFSIANAILDGFEDLHQKQDNAAMRNFCLTYNSRLQSAMRGLLSARVIRCDKNGDVDQASRGALWNHASTIIYNGIIQAANARQVAKKLTDQQREASANDNWANWLAQAQNTYDRGTLASVPDQIRARLAEDGDRKSVV